VSNVKLSHVNPLKVLKTAKAMSRKNLTKQAKNLTKLDKKLDGA
jgi:hypothetical protein